MPFSRRIAGHLALVGVQLADRAVHEQLRALADVGERGLQLVRHVPQEAVALVREIEQPLPQPLELPAEALEVVRAGDADQVGEGALAELADGAVELAQRPADAEGQREDRHDRQRHQQRGLPQQALARLQRRSSSAATSVSIWALLCWATRSTSEDSSREARRQVRGGRRRGAGRACSTVLRMVCCSWPSSSRVARVLPLRAGCAVARAWR